MPERPQKPAEEPPKALPPSESDSAYTAEEEAEVQKRLEELGYVE